MALKGNLQDFPVSRLLNLVRSARMTGTLTVEGSDRAAHLAFLEGQLIHAAYADQDGLPNLLERAGVLSAEQARAVIAHSTETSDKEVAVMLIGAGTVSQDDILRSVRAHTVDIACEVLTWQSGMFHFDAGQLPSEDHITVALDVESIVGEASRRRQARERGGAAWPDPNARFRFAATPPRGKLELSPEAWRLLPYVDPRNTLRQIARTVQLDEGQVQQIIHQLLQAGVIEVET